MLVVESDENGRFFFVPNPDRPCELVLGKPFASMRVGIVYGSRVSYLIDPETSALRAVVCYLGSQMRVVPFGALWGQWIDEEGRSHVVRDPIQLLSQPSLQFSVNEAGEIFTLAFRAHPNHAKAFSRSTRRRFMPGDYIFQISLEYQVPTGRLIRGRMVLRDKNTERVSHGYHLLEFPLLWPRVMKFDEKAYLEEQNRPTPRPKMAPAEPATPDEASEDSVSKASAEGKTKKVKRVKKVKRIRKVRKAVRAKNDGVATPTAKPGFKPPPRPPGFGFMGKPPAEPESKGTEGAKGPSRSDGKDSGDQRGPGSGAYRIRTPGSVNDPFGGKNVSSGKNRGDPRGSRGRPREQKNPEKPEARPIPATQHLPTGELVKFVRDEKEIRRQWQMIEPNLMLGRAERTYGLIANFAEQITERTPGWSPARLKAAFGDQPGAILIGVMEQWTINQVLAVAEINSESAKIMEWLREREIDRLLRLNIEQEIANAVQARALLRVDRSADHQSIRKTWRTLLQFLNADHGRRDERAIHRRKDEIAKHLQEARDFLLKVGF